MSAPLGSPLPQAFRDGVGDAAAARTDRDARRLRADAFRVNTTLGIAISALWGFVYLALMLPLAALVPWTYSVFMTVGLLFVRATGAYEPVRRAQLVLILILPFVLGLALGGLAASGAVVLWGLFAPLGALLLGSASLARGYLVAYAFLVMSSAVADPIVAATSIPVPASVREGFFAMDLLGAATAVFLAVGYVQRQKDAANARADSLLRSMLPTPIVDRLKDGALIADEIPEVSVLFVDLVGFTTMSARVAPGETVRFLNDLFGEFDDLTDRHGLEKIRTVGDGYMAVAGVPRPRPDHARAAARMALDLRAVVRARRYPDGTPLRCRIGLHAGGPIVAGIIGSRRFVYDTYGSAVNIASRMESQGLPDAIQVSRAFRDAVAPSGFRCEPRGVVEVKGVGPMETYLLVSG